MLNSSSDYIFYPSRRISYYAITSGNPYVPGNVTSEKNREMAFTKHLYHVVRILVSNTPNKFRNTNPFMWKQRSVCIYFTPQLIQKKVVCVG